MEQRSLGGSAADIQVGEIGYGCMGLTLGSTTGHRNISDEQAFAAMKAAADAGATFWNAGIFYGWGPNGEARNIELLARFFTEYPEYADKIFLSVKGGLQLNWQVDGSDEFLRKDVDNVLEILNGKKKLDMFECCRVDPKTPVEETIGALAKMIKEGKFNHIGLSEVSAATIRRAAKVHPIATVEIEYSLWATEAKTNGVLDTAKELGIAIIAYSPLGRGILAGNWKTPEDVPDWLRERFPRYTDENFATNVKFVYFLEDLAQRKGCTPAQLAIRWVMAQGDHIIPIPGASHIDRVRENLGAADIDLTEEELAEMNEFAEQAEVKGGRYGGPQAALTWG